MAGSILQTLMVFPYFRKAHSEIESDAEFEIYNDATGKLAMVKRHFNNADASYFTSLCSSTTDFSKFLGRSSYFSWEVFFHNRLGFIDSFCDSDFLYFWRLFQSGKNYPIK